MVDDRASVDLRQEAERRIRTRLQKYVPGMWWVGHLLLFVFFNYAAYMKPSYTVFWATTDGTTQISQFGMAFTSVWFVLLTIHGISVLVRIAWERLIQREMKTIAQEAETTEAINYPIGKRKNRLAAQDETDHEGFAHDESHNHTYAGKR
jgi:hypothetical protein